jgi:hypothetical protein
MEVMGYRIALGEPSIEVGTGDLCHRLYRRAIHETVCFRLGFLVLLLCNLIKPLEGVLGDCKSLSIGDISCIL